MNISNYLKNGLACCLLSLSLCLSAQPGLAPVDLQVKNEEAVNSKGLDFSPTFFEDGIVFISTNNAGLKKMTDDKLKLPTMSILRSRRDAEGRLSKPEPFSKELTSRFHEGPVCFDRTAERVFFSRNVVVRGQAKLAKDGEQKMKLFVAQKSGEAWGEATPLPFNNDEHDDTHPSLSIDGDKLFFSSNRPGGYGGMDLYVSFRLGDTWSDPLNLGAAINTSGNEAFPFLHADNTLYFASDGHAGTGGLDLYYASPEGSEWSKPVNLGTPFNTKGDDFGLIVDLDKINGYYSSNGNGGLGGDDIFGFHTENGNLDDFLLQNKRAPEREVDILVSVFDGASSAALADANVRILNLDQNNVIGRDSMGNLITLQSIDGQEVMKVVPPDKGIMGTTDAGGRFSAMLKPGNFAIVVSKEGWQTKQIVHKISKPGNEFVVSLDKAADKVHWNATLFNDQTNAPLSGATLILTHEATGKKDTITTDANGNVNYYLEKNSAYSVEIHQGGKQVGTTKINTTGWESGQQGKMTLNVTSTPLTAGTIIELPNIYYNYNDATLRPDSRKDLDLVSAIMQQYPSMVVELSSHTDSRGTSEYNADLSQRRAENVVEYLVRKGIAQSRLKPVGYGERQVRNRCVDGVECSEKDHARNRRTEIRVLAGADGAVVRPVEGVADAEGKKKVNQAPGNVNIGGGVEYLVIAGSFLMENRAVNQVNRLKKAGYEEASIQRFGSSPFYSVVVRKVGSQEEGLSLKRQLDSKEKIDSFLKPLMR